MESGDCFQFLKNSILSLYPVDSASLNELLAIFTPISLSPEDIFTNAGDYSSSFGFICNGIMKSYYIGHNQDEIIKNIYVNHMFALPLPSFIYRKPSYLNFKAVTTTQLLQAKFSKLEDLSLKHPTVYKFVRGLIDREWIVNRELHESGFHVYNSQSRFNIFLERYRKYINILEPSIISSFLQIPLKQVEKYIRDLNTIEKINY